MEYNGYMLHQLEEDLRSAYIRLGREEKTIQELKAAIERLKAKEIHNLGSERSAPLS